MSAKHTPGPWRLGPQHKDKSFAIHAASASVMHIVPFGSSIKSAEANANLIAAAPEMYEALQSLCGVFDGQDDVPIYVHRARAAIAKAEGRK